MIDNAPKVKWYYSDGFDAYQWLWYHFGRYETSLGKADTYSVEAISQPRFGWIFANAQVV